jgi:TetR/AcrR family transcriptional regulator, transcriptional repressor for nem operon
MGMLLARGYNHLGIQDVLAATNVPKGSFYHHFESKQDFALAVIDRYMAAVHEGLDFCLRDRSQSPLRRIRRFFEVTTESYRTEGFLGCLLGGIGQELSGINEVFRKRIELCISQIASKLETCLELAVERGEISPDADARHLASLLVNCWEGAALRTRLLRDPAPLAAMLDFYFQSLPPATPRTSRTRKRRASRRRTAPRGRRA